MMDTTRLALTKEVKQTTTIANCSTSATSVKRGSIDSAHSATTKVRSASLLNCDNNTVEVIVLPQLEEKCMKTAKMTPRFVLLVLCCMSHTLVMGYQLAVVSGLLLLNKDIPQSSFWKELLVGTTSAMAMVGSLCGGQLCDRFGRRATVRLTGIFYIIGAALQTAGIYHTLPGRILAGLGIGLSSVVVPIYLAENTIQKLRGRVIMLNQAALTFGQFLSGITAGIFSHIEVDSWRYLLGVILIPSVLQFVGFLWLPESSRYLVKKGKISEAQEVMHSLWKQSSKEEMKFLVASKGTDDETQSTSIRHNLKCIMMTPTVRRALLVACSLHIVNQFSGINVIIFYSSIVMKMSGIKDDSVAIWLSTIPVLTNFLFTFVGFYLIERIGRRRLLFLSTIGVIISLVFLSVVFWRIDKTSPTLSVHEQDSNSSHCVTHSLCSECVSDLSCGFCYIDNPTEGAINGSCLPTSIVASHHASIGRCNASSLREPTSEVSWTYNFCPSSLILFALIGQVLYIMSFASGLGPLPWAIGAEVFPTWARSLCNSIVTATLWLCSLLLTGTFLTMTQTFTTYGTFILMSIISSIGLVFWYIHLPETKGNSLEETELLFSKPFSSCSG